MKCDVFCKDMNSFLAISFVFDLIDKAHTVGHKIISSSFLEEVKPVLLFLFGQVNLFLRKQSFSSNRQSFMV